MQVGWADLLKYHGFSSGCVRTAFQKENMSQSLFHVGLQRAFPFTAARPSQSRKDAVFSLAVCVLIVGRKFVFYFKKYWEDNV